MRSILLLDNGSRRANSILNLRRLAGRLAERIGEPVHPVSLLHADQIPPAQLDDQPADILAPSLRRLLTEGVRDLVLIPLFFGPSRALSTFVPETATALADEFGPFRLRIAPELCPLPAGEPRLVDILTDHIRQTAESAGFMPLRVVLVDHGSPLPAVTAVRRWLGDELRQRLGREMRIDEAAMERRAGVEYDFNGELLEDQLRRLADADPMTPIVLAMLFLAAGRHAGPGGDIDTIRTRIEADYPGLRIHPSPLVGSHPGLIEILVSRLAQTGRL